MRYTTLARIWSHMMTSEKPVMNWISMPSCSRSDAGSGIYAISLLTDQITGPSFDRH